MTQTFRTCQNNMVRPGALINKIWAVLPPAWDNIYANHQAISNMMITVVKPDPWQEIDHEAVCIPISVTSLPSDVDSLQLLRHAQFPWGCFLKKGPTQRDLLEKGTTAAFFDLLHFVIAITNGFAPMCGRWSWFIPLAEESDLLETRVFLQWQKKCSVF